MATLLQRKAEKHYETLLLLAASFIITNFFFFIDEGFNNFTWMKSFGNWMVFVIYFITIFGFQILFATYIFRKTDSNIKLFFSSIAGTAVALLLLLWIF
ncbi:hypothetical protein [uncultured Chryseobacterium sp.]|uniref:hypothetical protein n=1 Tax=uncultured Chryseobacterium sp. TaxID=259322 RepID=UPI00262A473E|nr:hypothetical protein [uncultured Chryseobacterium sp.]